MILSKILKYSFSDKLKILSLVFFLTGGLFVSLFQVVPEVEAGDSYTKLLLHSDASNTETDVFTDFSDSTHVVNRNGNIIHDRDGVPVPMFSTQSSIEFDGINDYLSITDSTDWDFADQDFTLEAFVFKTAGEAGVIVAQTSGATSKAFRWESNASNQLVFSYSTNGINWASTVTSTSTIPNNLWVHVAVVRIGTSIYQYIGGAQDATVGAIGTDVIADSAAPLTIGSDNGTDFLAFHMEEPRVSNGIARWTAGFTPLGDLYGADEYDDVVLSVLVLGALVLDCDPSVDFGEIKYGTAESAMHQCSVTTDSLTGYSLFVRRDDPETTMDKIASPTVNIIDKFDWDPTANLGWGNAEPYSNTGLGFNLFTTTGTKNTNWWGTGTTCHDANNLYTGFPTGYQRIMQHNAYSAVPTITSICGRLGIDETQEAGLYDGTITYEAAVNP